MNKSLSVFRMKCSHEYILVLKLYVNKFVIDMYIHRIFYYIVYFKVFIYSILYYYIIGKNSLGVNHIKYYIFFEIDTFILLV